MSTTPADGDQASPTILLVDDEPDMLTLLQAVLSMQFPSHTVVAVPDGTRALEAMKGIRPDVLVSDYLMPGINGLELAQRVRATGASVPIVLITAFVDSALKTRVEQTGVVQAFLRKPVDPDELAATVRRLVAHAPAHVAASQPSRSH